MPALPHTTLFCPDCCREFRAAVWRVVAGGVVDCKHCGHGFRLDLTSGAHRQALDAARRTKADHRQRSRRADVPIEVLEAELIAVLQAMLAVLDETEQEPEGKRASG